MKQLIDPHKLAEILVAYRKTNGVGDVRMSQKILAQKIGVPYSTVQRWEYASVRISPMMYLRLKQINVISDQNL